MRRGEIVLDGFGGSGTTLIAAESTGRVGRLLEYDPLYCDTIVRRWERVTGKRATLVDRGATLEELAEERGVAGSLQEACSPELLRRRKPKRSPGRLRPVDAFRSAGAGS